MISNWVSLVHQLKPIVTIKVGAYWELIFNILECHYRMGICSKIWLLTKPNRSIANSIKWRVAQVYIALLEINVEILLKICKVSVEFAALNYSIKQQISLIIVNITKEVWVMSLIGRIGNSLLEKNHLLDEKGKVYDKE